MPARNNINFATSLSSIVEILTGLLSSPTQPEEEYFSSIYAITFQRLKSLGDCEKENQLLIYKTVYGDKKALEKLIDEASRKNTETCPDKFKIPDRNWEI